MALDPAALQDDLATLFSDRDNFPASQQAAGERWAKRPPPAEGDRIGRLVVLGPGPRDRTWLCRCDCGTIKPIPQDSLQRRPRPTGSCGCLQREATIAASWSHGEGDFSTREYRVYRAMLARCNNKNTRAYPDYGRRGITVCDRWSGKPGFANFLADMGRCPTGLTLDRIDNDRGYSPDNCAWRDMSAQNRNKRHRPGVTGEKHITRLKTRFRVQITGNRTKRHVGMFATLDEAKNARDVALRGPQCR
jgi:hypothetical protein